MNKLQLFIIEHWWGILKSIMLFVLGIILAFASDLEGWRYLMYVCGVLLWLNLYTSIVIGECNDSENERWSDGWN